MDRRLLTRVVLRNYKSIAACDVEPAQLSFLVGPNGSGKSNFLDALRFIADSLRFSIDHALRDRGGISEVRRRSGGHLTHFGIRVECSLEASRGHYTFRVGARAGGGYEVQREECRVFRPGDAREDYYDVESGRVTRSTLTPPPAAAADRLYLVNVSGVDAFRPVYDALSGTGFYNLNPEAIRDLQQTDPGELLKRDGSNAASVLSNLGARSADFKRRIEAYLGKVVPGVVGVDRRSVGPRETAIATIVEGHGEVDAVPVLLRRIAGRAAPGVVLRVPSPIRVQRKPGGMCAPNHSVDLDAARAAPSFDKLWRDVSELLGIAGRRG